MYRTMATANSRSTTCGRWPSASTGPSTLPWETPPPAPSTCSRWCWSLACKLLWIFWFYQHDRADGSEISVRRDCRALFIQIHKITKWGHPYCTILNDPGFNVNVGPLFVFQAFLWLPREGEALYEDLSVQSSDGQKVRLRQIDALKRQWRSSPACSMSPDSATLLKGNQLQRI